MGLKAKIGQFIQDSKDAKELADLEAVYKKLNAEYAELEGTMKAAIETYDRINHREIMMDSDDPNKEAVKNERKKAGKVLEGAYSKASKAFSDLVKANKQLVNKKKEIIAKSLENTNDKGTILRLRQQYNDMVHESHSMIYFRSADLNKAETNISLEIDLQLIDNKREMQSIVAEAKITKDPIKMRSLQHRFNMLSIEGKRLSGNSVSARTIADKRSKVCEEYHELSRQSCEACKQSTIDVIIYARQHGEPEPVKESKLLEIGKSLTGTVIGVTQSISSKFDGVRERIAESKEAREIKQAETKFNQLNAEYKEIERELKAAIDKSGKASLDYVLSGVGRMSPEGIAKINNRKEITAQLAEIFKEANKKYKELREAYQDYITKKGKQIDHEMETADKGQRLGLMVKRSRMLADYALSDSIRLSTLGSARRTLNHECKFEMSVIDEKIAANNERINEARAAGKNDEATLIEIENDDLISDKELHETELFVGEDQLANISEERENSSQMHSKTLEIYGEAVTNKINYVREHGEPAPTKSEKREERSARFAGLVSGVKQTVTDKIAGAKKKAAQLREAAKAAKEARAAKKEEEALNQHKEEVANTNPEEMIQKISANPSDIAYVPATIPNYQEVCLEAVKKNPMVIGLILPENRTELVCKAAKLGAAMRSGMSKVFAEKFPDIAKDFDAIGYINSNDEFQSELIDKLVKEETEKTTVANTADTVVKEEPAADEHENDGKTVVTPAADEHENDGKTVVTPAADEQENDGKTVVTPAADEQENDGKTVVTPAADENENDGKTVVTPAADEHENDGKTSVVKEDPAPVVKEDPAPVVKEEPAADAVVKEEPAADTVVKEEPAADTVVKEEPKKKKGFFARIFGGRDKKKEDKTTTEPVVAVVDEKPAAEADAPVVTKIDPAEIAAATNIQDGKDGVVRDEVPAAAPVEAGRDQVPAANPDEIVRDNSTPDAPTVSSKLSVSPAERAAIQAEAEAEIKAEYGDKWRKKSIAQIKLKRLVEQKMGKLLGQKAIARNNGQEEPTVTVKPQEPVTSIVTETSTVTGSGKKIPGAQRSAMMRAAKAKAKERMAARNEGKPYTGGKKKNRRLGREIRKAYREEQRAAAAAQVAKPEPVAAPVQPEVPVPPTEKDGLSEYFVKYSQKYGEYYSGNKGTKGNAHTKEEIAFQRKLNAGMKKLVTKRIEDVAREESGGEPDRAVIDRLQNPVDAFDMEALVADERATLKLFQIAANGVYDDGGNRVRLTRKQRVALSGVLIRVAEKKVEAEHKKAQEVEAAKAAEAAKKAAADGLQEEGAEISNE